LRELRKPHRLARDASSSSWACVAERKPRRLHLARSDSRPRWRALRRRGSALRGLHGLGHRWPTT